MFGFFFFFWRERKLFVENSIKRLENPHAINVLVMTRHYKWYRFECQEVGHMILEIFNGSKWFKCICMETLKMIIYMLISRKWKGISTWPYKPIITRIFFGAHISSGCYLTHHFVKENCRSFISRSKTFSKNDAPFWDHNSIAFCPQRSCVSINGEKNHASEIVLKKKRLIGKYSIIIIIIIIIFILCIVQT